MKNKTLAAVLSLLLGGIGIHKFYLGKNKQGILYLLFFWTFIPSILGLIDAIKLFMMSNEDFDFKYNKKYVSFYNSSSKPRYDETDSNIVKDIKSLFDLKEKGAITEEEYLEKKNELQGPLSSSRYDDSYSAKIKDLGVFFELKEKDGITEEEYQEKKNELL